MPGFGTTSRTHHNAQRLAQMLSVTLREISIRGAVRHHLQEIGHEENVHDVTYENAQARERTQILMAQKLVLSHFPHEGTGACPVMRAVPCGNAS